MTRVTRARRDTRFLKRRWFGRQALRRRTWLVRRYRLDAAANPYAFAGMVLRVKRRGVRHTR